MGRTDGRVMIYLGLRIILVLGMRRHDGPSLVCILEITDCIMDHARTARIHQRLDARLLTRLDHTRCPIHINLPVQLMPCAHQIRGCGMDHYIWLRFFEDRDQGGERGDIAIIVGNAVRIWAPIARGRKVQHGDVAGVGVVEEIHNVMAQEPAAANYKHVA